MYQLIRVAGLSTMLASGIALSPVIVIAQEAASDSISPTPEVGGAPRNYGVVRSANNNTLELRQLSGGYRTYTVSSDVTSSLALSPGDLVAYDADADGMLTKLEPPKISQFFEGTITDIQGDQITVVAPDGSSLTTTVAPNSVDRLALAPGQGLSVTQYEGIETTKICSTSKFASSPSGHLLPKSPAPAVLPQPIPALW